MSIKGLWDCDNETYHSETNYVSNSQLDEFRESVERYHGLFIAKTIERPAPTPAKMLGTLLHTCILEPGKEDERFLIQPPGDGRTASVKEARQRVTTEARKTGMTIVTAEHWDTAKRMADAVHDRKRHPAICDALEVPGLCEQSVLVEGEFGKMKSRFDKIFDAGHILDLKTTRNVQPSAFGRDAVNYGYHRQAAFYEDVRDLAMGEGPGVFYHLAIWSEEPYDAILYEMDPVLKNIGRKENRALLAELQRRRQRNDWSPRYKGVQRLEAPAWAYKERNSNYE